MTTANLAPFVRAPPLLTPVLILNLLSINLLKGQISELISLISYPAMLITCSVHAGGFATSSYRGRLEVHCCRFCSNLSEATF